MITINFAEIAVSIGTWFLYGFGLVVGGLVGLVIVGKVAEWCGLGKEKDKPKC